MSINKTGRATVVERLATGSITEQQALELTREAALRTLDRVDKSRSDLAASLLRRGYPANAVELVLDRLTEVGVINDAAYAAAVVRSRQGAGGFARSAIMLELARRGIGSEIAEDALGQVTSEAENDALQLLIAKSLRRTVGLDKQTRLRRATSALLRKGYESSQVYPAVLAALTDQLGEQGTLDTDVNDINIKRGFDFSATS